MTARKLGAFAVPLAALFVIGFFSLVLPTHAQDPIPTSADPSSAEQETFDLEVTVTGDNFSKDSEVRFLVTGSENDEGGIKVKKVKAQGPKTLKVTIDVPLSATTGDFDIEVMSRGRRGKGTELFRVLEKTHPNQDNTPPGAPTGMSIVDETFNAVTFEWTVPADDGYDQESGRVNTCWCSSDGVDFGYGECGILPGSPSPGWGDPEDYAPWPDPGRRQTAIQLHLEQATEYQFWVRCRDDAMNWSSPVDVIATTRPFSEYQDPTWRSEEVKIDGSPVQFDAVAGHGFTADGEVILAGTVVLWDQASRKVPPPRFTRFITGSSNGTNWVWRYGDYEDLPDLVGPLHMDPQGLPVLEGAILKDARRQIYDLVYAYHDGSNWRTEVVATEAGPSRHRSGFAWERGFAFDPGGNPAIAWCADWGDSGPRLARRVATDHWIIEEISQEACETGSAGLAFSGQGYPAVSYVLEREWPAPYETKVAIWSDQGWVEEEVCRGPDFPYGVGCSWTPQLAFDPSVGDFVAVAQGGEGDFWVLECGRNGPHNWQCDSRVMGILAEGGVLDHRWVRSVGLDSSGELFVSHAAAGGPGLVLSRRPSGQTAWTQEHVDHPATTGLPITPITSLGVAVFLALDPTGLPTLTWNWTDPNEYHLYFAWKETP